MAEKPDTLTDILVANSANYANLVPFNLATDRLLHLDFTLANSDLTGDILEDTELFSQYINRKIAGYTYGIGGYNELRTVYSRSRVFDDADEPRRLHLGVDIWGPAGTPVFAPLKGTIHSFAFNDHFGDYGATIILQHVLDGISFYTLYGHLSLQNLQGLHAGNVVSKGQAFCHFGPPAENGHWPPHLHFQVIKDMQGNIGDYPGVCKASEGSKYLQNCPDSDIILQLVQYAQ